MKLERALYQKSYLYLIGFFIFVLVGFWATYFTRILDQENYRYARTWNRDDTLVHFISISSLSHQK